jgi:hypothetical protein
MPVYPYTLSGGYNEASLVILIFLSQVFNTIILIGFREAGEKHEQPLLPHFLDLLKAHKSPRHIIKGYYLLDMRFRKNTFTIYLSPIVGSLYILSF